MVRNEFDSSDSDFEREDFQEREVSFVIENVDQGAQNFENQKKQIEIGSHDNVHRSSLKVVQLKKI